MKHRQKRNARIYCELLGYGLSGDAYHITSGREDGEGALLAMKNAFRNLRSIKNEHKINEKTMDEKNDYELFSYSKNFLSTKLFVKILKNTKRIGNKEVEDIRMKNPCILYI